jgi:hypothetical protein
VVYAAVRVGRGIMDGVAFLPVMVDGERLGVQGVKGIAAGDHGSVISRSVHASGEVLLLLWR